MLRLFVSFSSVWFCADAVAGLLLFGPVVQPFSIHRPRVPRSCSLMPAPFPFAQHTDTLYAGVQPPHPPPSRTSFLLFLPPPLILCYRVSPFLYFLLLFRPCVLWQFAGELAVKEAFPEATIVRPAKLFGNNDRLLTWIALMATRTGRVPLVSFVFAVSVCFLVGSRCRGCNREQRGSFLRLGGEDRFAVRSSTARTNSHIFLRGCILWLSSPPPPSNLGLIMTRSTLYLVP